jgi:hypothetical protein
VTGAGPQSPAVVFHGRYLALAEQIERRFPVSQWRAADLEIWPLARMDLYLDLYRASVGITPPPARAFSTRILEHLATPLLNAWRSRGDLHHWIARPRAAHAIFLGDGVSLDRTDGSWRDRFGEPLMAALQQRGRETFLMQAGDLSRLPWHRPTYAANLMLARGARLRGSIQVQADLPQRAQVARFLSREGVVAPCMAPDALLSRARTILATAAAFEQLLRVVRPTLAFVVTYYAELGPAFLLACRRQGVLSIDLQHCPQEGAHKAYTWWALPSSGYAVLPAVFWHWKPADAALTQAWTSRLELPWHRGLHGGHVQLTPFLDDADPTTRALDRQFQTLAGGVRFEREILVALQPVNGYRHQWDALARQIEASPARWRWWIRRHPASRDYQDEEYRSLVNLRRPNVIVDACSSLPLPALLRHMHALVSRYSGASAEAEDFGVPAIFLSDEARGQFSSLIARGAASIVDVTQLLDYIPRMPGAVRRPAAVTAPRLSDTLSLLEAVAPDYRQQCHDNRARRRNLSEARSSCG